MRERQLEKLIKKRSLKKKDIKRACGDCTACCTVLGVSDLTTPKPKQTPCIHLDKEARGCGIYATRPSSCVGFACMWLAGHPKLTGAMRPDRFGVIVWYEETKFGATYCVDETIPGAFETPTIKGFLRDLGASTNLILFLPNGMRRLLVKNTAMNRRELAYALGDMGDAEEHP